MPAQNPLDATLDRPRAIRSTDGLDANRMDCGQLSSAALPARTQSIGCMCCDADMASVLAESRKPRPAKPGEKFSPGAEPKGSVGEWAKAQTLLKP